jgi:hypothetical protein
MIKQPHHYEVLKLTLKFSCKAQNPKFLLDKNTKLQRRFKMKWNEMCDAFAFIPYEFGSMSKGKSFLRPE